MVCLICIDVMIIWTKQIKVEIGNLFIPTNDKLISMVTMCFSWIKNMMSHVQLVYGQESLNRALLLKFGYFFVFGLWNGVESQFQMFYFRNSYKSCRNCCPPPSPLPQCLECQTGSPLKFYPRRRFLIKLKHIWRKQVLKSKCLFENTNYSLSVLKNTIFFIDNIWYMCINCNLNFNSVCSILKKF